MIVRASVALALYELFAGAIGLPLISRWRGPLRWVMGGYVAWLVTHLIYEWTADDIARAAVGGWATAHA